MQSGPFEVDQTTSLNKATPESPNTTTQHGFQDYRQQAPGLLPCEECAESQDPSRGFSVTLASSTGDGRGTLETQLPWLSASGSATTRSDVKPIADQDDDLIVPSSGLSDDASSPEVFVAHGLIHPESASLMDLPNGELGA